MSFDLDDSMLEFWLKAEYWDSLEAAFILSGIIPSKETMYGYGFYDGSRGCSMEPETEAINELVKRKFPLHKMTPKDCLQWAQEIEISLSEELAAKAGDCGILLVSKSLSEMAASQNIEVQTFSQFGDLSWSQIKINFDRTGDALTIEARGLQETVHFAQAGFLDGRKRNLPDSNWIFLKRIAGHNGRITAAESKLEDEFRRNADKYVQTIRKRLKAMLPKVSGDPFPSDGVSTWKSAFALKDLDPTVYAYSPSLKK